MEVLARARIDGTFFGNLPIAFCLLVIPRRTNDEKSIAFLLEVEACFKNAVEDFAMSNILRKINSGEK